MAIVAAGGGARAGGAHLAYPVWCIQPDGALRMLFRSATSHVSFDGSIHTSTSADGGHTWTAPRALFPAPQAGADEYRDPDILVLGSDRVLAALTRRTASGTDVEVAWSDDGGGTWTPPTPAVGDAGAPALCRCEDGTLLMAAQVRDNRDDGLAVAVYRSHDAGAAWSPLAVAADRRTTGGSDGVEARMVQLRSGALLLVFHTEDDFPQRYWRTHSTDAGRTWAPPALAGFAGSNRQGLCLTPDGDVVITYWDGGPHLLLRTSRDGGSSWGAGVPIAPQAYPPGGTQWSSPGILYAPGRDAWGLGVAFGWENRTQDRSSIFFDVLPRP